MHFRAPADCPALEMLSVGVSSLKGFNYSTERNRLSLQRNARRG